MWQAIATDLNFADDGKVFMSNDILQTYLT